MALLLLLAACSGSGGGLLAGSTSTSTTVTTATTATTPPVPGETTTVPPATEPAVQWPAVANDGVARALLTPNGIVVPVIADNGDGTYVVGTPCSNQATVAGTPISGANVVLDPGHGGNESGAVGPTGLVEKDVNFEITLDVKQLLEASGATVVLTRTTDQNTTLKTRAEIATALQPQAFVSIHHNAEPDGPTAGPGAETYYQIANSESRRLSGLVWEELVAAFEPFQIGWVGDTDHGAKYRPGSSGGDYYGILRRAAGVPTVLSEAAFISSPAEEQLLETAEFKHAEAQALANAITRFVATPDPGSGYVEPYPRTDPAGGGGGPQGCVDPQL